MRNFKTSPDVGWAMALLVAAGFLFAPVAVQADIVELSYGDSKGEKSATGYVLQGSRNMKRLGKRRATTSPVILPPLSLEVLSRKEPASAPQDKVESQKPKPRFGYGSDYQAEGGDSEIVVPSRPAVAAGPAPVDSSTAIRFLPVRQNRTYYPLVPFYGFSANPYFYRPGSPGRYYLNAPGCFTGGFSAGTSFNVYHGGNLTFSSWSPVFGCRYYR